MPVFDRYDNGITRIARELGQVGIVRLVFDAARAANPTATLLINDHFNKTGTGTDLGRISQAGMGEWADSWLLLSHRADPDVAAGDFRLQLDVGSRQWGGRTFDLDMSVGEYDHDTGEHVGSFAYTVARSDPNASKVLKASAAQNTLIVGSDCPPTPSTAIRLWPIASSSPPNSTALRWPR